MKCNQYLGKSPLTVLKRMTSNRLTKKSQTFKQKLDFNQSLHNQYIHQRSYLILDET